MADDEVNFVDIADSIYEELKSHRADIRADVVYHLLRLVEDENHPEIEAAWIEEIKRRDQQMESGAVKGIPAEVVMEQARERLKRLADGDE